MTFFDTFQGVFSAGVNTRLTTYNNNASKMSPAIFDHKYPPI